MYRTAAGPGLRSASFRPCLRRSVGVRVVDPVKVLGAQGSMGMFWGTPRPQWGGGTQPFSWYSWFSGATDEVETQERRRVRAYLGNGRAGVALRQRGQSGQEDDGVGVGDAAPPGCIGLCIRSGLQRGQAVLDVPTWICYSMCGPCPVCHPGKLRISVLCR